MSLQKLAVMGLAVVIVLEVGRVRLARRLELVWLLLGAGLAASAAGNILVDRASWKLDALNRPVYALFAHMPRFSELAFSQNGLAAFLILVIPFGFVLAREPRWRTLAGAATAALVLELLVTESRAAMLSLGLASGLFALYLRGRWRWLALAVPGLALALLASGLVALPMNLSWLPTGGSSAERLGIWQSALLMIADMPLTGIGLGMFQRVYPLYILPAYQNIHPHAHNLFLQTYLDAGPLGCAGMLLLA
ncbi:MAG: O-antigen ligase family protein, partial [Chloroflexota bacterium]